MVAPVSAAAAGAASDPLDVDAATRRSERDRLIELLLGDLSETDADAAVDIANTDVDEYDDLLDDVDDKIIEFNEDKFVRDAFQKGIDLREYAKSIEGELEGIEESHITDCTSCLTTTYYNNVDINNGHALADLYQQINTCDSLFANMESLLSSFQEHLGGLSAEIKSLQDQSIHMDVRLKNRMAVQSQLNTVIEGLALSPALIKTIFEADINEEFIQAITELNGKMSYWRSNQSKPIKALKDVGPEIERLRLRAADKIRTFLLEKIRLLSASMANIPIIQQTVLLKYKVLNHFLVQRHSEAAMEVRLNYIQIMSHYYSSRFSKYSSRIQKLQSVIADKYDLLGIDDNTKKGLFGTGKFAVKDKTSVFTLGDRMDVVNNLDAPVILAHVAEKQQTKFPFEVIFRSLTRILIDNCCSEYCFLLEFFGALRIGKAAQSPTQIAGDVFNEVFGSMLKIILDTIKNFAESSFDAVGILLCIRVNTQHQAILQTRQIPCLDTFTNNLNLILWPRFQAIMDLHIGSIKKAVNNNGSGFFGGSPDIHPHYVTRRYAELAASVLLLNDTYNDQMLETSLSRLRIEVETFIVRMAADFPDRKSKIIFLINNYDLITSILEKYQVPTVMNERTHFATLLNNRILEFVDEVLSPHFQSLITFVGDIEKSDTKRIDASRYEMVCQDFNTTWKSSLATINQTVLQSFSNFKNGTTVLHTVLKQLVVYYQAFLGAWEAKFPPTEKIKVQPVMMHQVVVEIKSKYKSNF